MSIHSLDELLQLGKGLVVGKLPRRVLAECGSRLADRSSRAAIERDACAEDEIDCDAGAVGRILQDHWEIIERVRELTNGRFCDRVIEAVGKQWPLDLAAELTCERGRLVITGYHQDDEWSGRAAVQWVRKLAAGETFSETTEGLLQTATLLDRLYGKS